MNKSDKQEGVQMYLSEKEEWTGIVPVLDGVAVSYARQGQVDECTTGKKEEITLATNLMEQITALPNMKRACERVIKNGGSAGVDGMSVKELRGWFSKHHKSLRDDLLKGTYEVQCIREVAIPKPKGGYRQLGIPTVKDRLVQQAINQVLTNIYEPTFSPTSYGFRKGRSAKNALVQASHYLSTERTYIVDIDMAKFFDEVNHDRLLSRLRHRISDSRLLGLIHKYLKAGSMKGGLSNQRIKGTPQGSPLSPLLSNIVLDELDKELSKRGHCYVRYADDMLILVKSEASAARVMRSTRNFIEGQMQLKVNEEKSRVCRPEELNYLGHCFSKGGEIRLSKESETRLKSKLRKITRRNRGRSLKQVITELNSLLRGWLNYFKLAKMKKKLASIEAWLRRRLRSYRLKQCKRAIGIVRFLNRTGVPSKRAWTTAASRSGWWLKSRTPASQEGMNNEWFKEQGLYSLSSNYLLLHI